MAARVTSLSRPTVLALAMALPLAGLAPAFADETVGTVVAHDRKAHRVVMDDRTIYEYDPAKTELPGPLAAGDEIRIVYQGGEDGITAIDAIEMVKAAATESDG